MKTINKFEVSQELADYDHKAAEKLVGTIVKRPHDDSEYLIKTIVEHHFLVIRDDGFLDTWEIKRYFKDIKEKEKQDKKYDEIEKLFETFCFKDKKRQNSDGTNYIVGMSNNEGFLGRMFDHRLVRFDYFGSFGITIKGWSNVDIKRLVDEKEFLRIPREKIKEQALEDFKQDFKKHVDLKSEIMFFENDLQDNQEINITFWNPQGTVAFRITGPYSDSDKITGTGGWGKTWYHMESGEIKKHPTKTANGNTGGRNKFQLSKKASLVSADIVYEKVFPLMEKLIDSLFKQTTEEKLSQ